MLPAPLKILFLPLLLLSSPACCQKFDFAARESIATPEPVLKKLRAYIELHDGMPMQRIGNGYPYVPVYNVLNRKERRFTDGVYYFLSGEHDSGRLFITQRGTITILRSGSTVETLSDYVYFLKHNTLSEQKQMQYLSAVTAYIKFWYADRQELIRLGVLLKLE